MKKLSNAEITTVILLIGEASGVFAGFCPSWFTVSSEFFNEGSNRKGNVRRIRQGEVAATAIVLGTGWAVTQSMGGDMVPFWSSVAISAIFVAGYEYAIAHPSKDDGPEEDADTQSQIPTPGGKY